MSQSINQNEGVYVANAEHKEKWLPHFNSRKMIPMGPCWAQLCHVFKSSPLQRVPLVGHRGALAVALPAGGCWDPQERQSIPERLRKGKMLGKVGWRKGGTGGSHPKRGGVDSAHSCRAQCWWCQHWARTIIPTLRHGPDILFTGKEPFSIPCYPEKEKKASKRKKKTLSGSLKANVPT